MLQGAVVGVQGSLKGKRFTLLGGEPMTFGRSDENVVVLHGGRASRLHAELRQDDDAFVLEDRGSSNGTWVNGRRVTVHRLQSGDQFAMGDHVFRFETPGADGAALEPPTMLASARTLRAIVTGGGPVGLSFVVTL